MAERPFLLMSAEERRAYLQRLARIVTQTGVAAEAAVAAARALDTKPPPEPLVVPLGPPCPPPPPRGPYR